MKSMVFDEQLSMTAEQIISENLENAFKETDAINEARFFRVDPRVMTLDDFMINGRDKFMDKMSTFARETNKILIPVPYSLRAIPNADQDGNVHYITNHIKAGYQFISYDQRDTTQVEKSETGKYFFMGKLTVYHYYLLKSQLGTRNIDGAAKSLGLAVAIDMLNKKKESLFIAYDVEFFTDPSILIDKYHVRKEEVAGIINKADLSERGKEYDFATSQSDFAQECAQYGDDKKYHRIHTIYFIVTKAKMKAKNDMESEIVDASGNTMECVHYDPDTYKIEVNIKGVKNRYLYDTITHKWGYIQGRVKEGNERQQRYPRIGNPALPWDKVGVKEKNIARDIVEKIKRHDPNPPAQFINMKTYLQYAE